jgi:hypothetical protein
MKTDMIILVKYLIVKSLHLKDGYINIKLLKILQEIVYVNTSTCNLHIIIAYTFTIIRPAIYRITNII